MAAAKPAGKAPIPAAKSAPKVPEVPEVTLMSGDTFNVKNVGKRCLCLSKGTIEIDKVGLATVAEYSCLSQHMKKV